MKKVLLFGTVQNIFMKKVLLFGTVLLIGNLEYVMFPWHTSNKCACLVSSQVYVSDLVQRASRISPHMIY